MEEAKSTLEVLGVGAIAGSLAGAAASLLKDYLLAKVQRGEKEADRAEAAREAHRLALMTAYQEMLVAHDSLQAHANAVAGALTVVAQWRELLRVSRIQAGFGAEQKAALARHETAYSQVQASADAAKEAWSRQTVTAAEKLNAVSMIESDPALLAKLAELRKHDPVPPGTAADVDAYIASAGAQRHRLSEIAEAVRGRFSPERWKEREAEQAGRTPARQLPPAASSVLPPGPSRNPES
jgi:hypothetical protein